MTAASTTSQQFDLGLVELFWGGVGKYCMKHKILNLIFPPKKKLFYLYMRFVFPDHTLNLAKCPKKIIMDNACPRVSNIAFLPSVDF